MATSKDNRINGIDISARGEEDFLGGNANYMPMDEKQSHVDGCRMPTCNSAKPEPNVQPKNYCLCPGPQPCVIS